VFRGIYADASRDLGHRVRCTAAAAFLLPPGAAIAGRSAAHLYGAGNPGTDDPVEVVVPPGSQVRVNGIRAHYAAVSDGDRRRHDDLAITTPERTCWDLAQWLDTVEAVVLIDQLLRARVVTVQAMEAYARARAGDRGWKRLLHVANLAEPGAESPPESRVRVRIVLAGLPRPVPQYVIDDHGRFLARVDLAWPEHRVAVEYDGLWHAGSAEQIHADRQRLNRLVGSDWVVLHVTSKRLRDDFDGFLDELRALLHSRRAR
jgi:hypothetical protein